MVFYWNNVTEKSGLFNPSDMDDYPIYVRLTVAGLIPFPGIDFTIKIHLSFIPYPLFDMKYLFSRDRITGQCLK
jgi:hypothetical protein